MSRFLTNEMKEGLNYIVDLMQDIEKDEVKEKLYHEIELFLRAKHKLEQSYLMGTKQEYESKLEKLLDTIIRTSTFIESPIEFKIPAPYSAIIDILKDDLLNIFGGNKDFTKSAMYIATNDGHSDDNSETKIYKLRKKSSAYDESIEKLFLLNDELNTNKFSSGCSVTPSKMEGYEIGYTLIPSDKKLIIHRSYEDEDLEIYLNHPLFFTNGIWVKKKLYSTYFQVL